MNTKKILITQSNYIPWKGYFDAINLSDVFVVYDDMQYTKRDWRNRNLIKTAQGLKWLSIPVEVSGKYFQKIRDTKIANKDWRFSHLEIIKQNYKNARCYKQMMEWIEPTYKSCDFLFLTEVNIHFITAINNFLGINTELKYSSEFQLQEDKTQRLVNICIDSGAGIYYTGPAAKDYMQLEKFEEAGILVEWLDYTGYKEYEQLYPPFEHAVSILDLIFNMGEDSIKQLKSFNVNS
jgi:hypothetical protein